MFDRLKSWFNQASQPSRSQHIALANLPAAKPLSDALLAESRLVVLDLETTGFNPAKDQVIAIGAVAINHLEIPLNDQFELILRRPELDISETVLIHGIGPEALKYGQDTEDALVHLMQWVDGDPILAFRSAFDEKFLTKALKRSLGYKQPHTWLDVAEMMPALFPDANTGGQSMDNWTDYFGLEASTRHHASADAMVTAELALIALNKALKNGITTTQELDYKLRYYRRITTINRP